MLRALFNFLILFASVNAATCLDKNCDSNRHEAVTRISKSQADPKILTNDYRKGPPIYRQRAENVALNSTPKAKPMHKNKSKKKLQNLDTTANTSLAALSPNSNYISETEILSKKSVDGHLVAKVQETTSPKTASEKARKRRQQRLNQKRKERQLLLSLDPPKNPFEDENAQEGEINHSRLTSLSEGSLNVHPTKMPPSVSASQSNASLRPMAACFEAKKDSHGNTDESIYGPMTGKVSQDPYQYNRRISAHPPKSSNFFDFQLDSSLFDIDGWLKFPPGFEAVAAEKERMNREESSLANFHYLPRTDPFQPSQGGGHSVVKTVPSHNPLSLKQYVAAEKAAKDRFLKPRYPASKYQKAAFKTNQSRTPPKCEKEVSSPKNKSDAHSDKVPPNIVYAYGEGKSKRAYPQRLKREDLKESAKTNLVVKDD
jgi:hypothetical protein